jgi:carbonic anhydrase
MAPHLEPGSLKQAAEIGLRKLKQGNARFVRGEARFPTVCKETLASLAKKQKPFATILGCSDSRVPPELIFDANFGELFIVRVAGNVTDGRSDAATVEIDHASAVAAREDDALVEGVAAPRIQ